MPNKPKQITVSWHTWGQFHQHLTWSFGASRDSFFIRRLAHVIKHTEQKLVVILVIFNRRVGEVCRSIGQNIPPMSSFPSPEQIISLSGVNFIIILQQLLCQKINGDLSGTWHRK